MAHTVLFVETGSGFGGSAVCLDTLLHFMDRAAYRPMVAYVGKGLAIERIQKQRVPLVLLHRGFAWLELVWLILRHRVDVVHANNELYSHCATILAACATGRPCVVHMRGIRSLTRLERVLIPLVAHFIVISDVGRRHYAREGIPASRSSTIYDGIDLQLYNGHLDGSGIRRTLGVHDDDVLVGIVSRLVPMKGHVDFLDAMTQVMRELPSVHGVIIGGDPEPGRPFLRQLLQLTRSRGLGKRITFLGWRDDVPTVTAALDVAVQASRYIEGFGTSIMEAMALGKPVVATAAGGVTELMEGDVTGLLVPVGDTLALSAAIRRLAAHPEQRRRFGQAGRRRIEQRFDQRQSTRRIEALYGRLINGQRT